MTRPFRFGIQTSRAATGQEWVEKARKIEDLGFSSLFIPDHFEDQLAPLLALTAAAGATSTLRLGTMVLDNDYRHPLVLTKELA
ncbi:MAG: LLM class flavin-dependent oxidoreductase, partial [Dehalococcoidia bacterium]